MFNDRYSYFYDPHKLPYYNSGQSGSTANRPLQREPCPPYYASWGASEEAGTITLSGPVGITAVTVAGDW